MTTVSTSEYISTTFDTTLKTEDTDYGFLDINEEMYNDFSKISNIYLTSAICCIGLIGNVTGLVVLLRDPDRRKMKNYIYLLSLFVADILHLVYGIFDSVLNLIELLDWKTAIKVNVFVIKFKTFIDMLLNHIIAAMIIAMSLERLMALVRPFNISGSVLIRYSKTIIFVSVLVSCIYLSPFAFGFLPNEYLDSTNRTLILPRTNPKFKELVNTVAIFETFLLHFFAPTLILFINVGILVSYSRFSSQRAKVLKEDQSTKQAQLTIIVICIAGLYILLSLPNVFVQTLMLTDLRYRFGGKYQMTCRFFLHLGDLLARINASIDFVIYIIACPRYRLLIKSVFYTSCSQKAASNYPDALSPAADALPAANIP